MGAKYSLYGWNFVPLVTEELNLICGLDILFLRPSAPGQLVSGGDLDNRLKTLFDALRIPEANERYADRVPDDADEKPFYCLLSDDKLVASRDCCKSEAVSPRGVSILSGHLHG